MSFPDSPRILFGKNPLEEVVCQLRFPPILRIDVDQAAVATFQERVRQRFPLYGKTAAILPVGLQLPPQFMQVMMAGAGTTNHEFASTDLVWKISLSRDFVALTTNKYTEWSDFKERLQNSLDALSEVFGPTFFQRVGLRYRDRIDRDRLGLSDTPWSELLSPPILGELGDNAIGPLVEHVARELVVSLGDGVGRVRMVHGLQRDNETVSYIIDSDFFLETQTEPGAVTHVLDTFNRQAGRLFRWCITARLSDAMDPRRA